MFPSKFRYFPYTFSFYFSPTDPQSQLLGNLRKACILLPKLCRFDSIQIIDIHNIGDT